MSAPQRRRAAAPSVARSNVSATTTATGVLICTYRPAGR